MVFLRDLFLVLYYSFYILLLSIKSYLIHFQVINSTLMTFNFVYHSRLLTSHTILLILSKLYLMSIIGCHLTFFLSIFQKLNFSSLVSQNSSKNWIIQLFIYLILSPVDSARNLGVIFDSNLTFLIIFLLCLNHAYITFEISDVSAIPSIVPQRVPYSHLSCSF